MFPVLFNFGPITITTLGLFSVLSFFFGGFLIWRKAKQEHIEDTDIFDLIFISLFAGLIGGRLVFILSNYENYGLNFQQWLDPVNSHGFAWFGFLLGWMIGAKWICHNKKWTFFKIADISVFGVITAQILLRIGQFFDSSFVGSNTNLPWGLPFPGFEGRQHPLSFYEIPFLLFLAWLLKYFDKHYRLYSWYRGSRGEAKPGFLWLSYLLILSILHILLDFVFTRQPIIAFISFRQIMVSAIMWLSIFWFWWQAGDSFDVWKLRDKWFGNNKKTKLLHKKEMINELFKETKPETVIEKENVKKQEATETNSSGLNTSTGRRFFRSRK